MMFLDILFTIPQKRFKSKNARHSCVYRIRVRILARVKKTMVESAADV